MIIIYVKVKRELAHEQWFMMKGYYSINYDINK